MKEGTFALINSALWFHTAKWPLKTENTPRRSRQSFCPVNINTPRPEEHWVTKIHTHTHTLSSHLFICICACLQYFFYFYIYILHIFNTNSSVCNLSTVVSRLLWQHKHLFPLPAKTIWVESRIVQTDETIPLTWRMKICFFRVWLFL